MRVVGLGIAGLMVLTVSLPAIAATPISPDEVKAQFGTGTPFNGVTVPGGRKYSLTLNLDGSAQMTLVNDKTSRTGTWRVSSKGYCAKWGTNPEHCYRVEQNGGQYDVLDVTGKLIAHWTKP